MTNIIITDKTNKPLGDNTKNDIHEKFSSLNNHFGKLIQAHPMTVSFHTEGNETKVNAHMNIKGVSVQAHKLTDGDNLYRAVDDVINAFAKQLEPHKNNH